MQVCILLLGSYPPDIRVRKEADALWAAGHNLTLLCSGPSDDPPRQVVDGIEVIRLCRHDPLDRAGALYSLAVHDVDIYSHLLECAPDTIDASLDSFVREGIDETATVTLTYGETTGVIHSSWQVPAFGKHRQLVVVGTERAASIDYLANTELELFDAQVVSENGRLRAHNEGSIVHEVPEREPLKAEVMDFLAVSERGETPRTNGRVGARAVELLERAEVAGAGHTLVPVDIETRAEAD